MPRLEFPPDPRMLEGMQSSSLPFRTCLEEILDNSSDADATLIVVMREGDTLSITDNGKGVRNLKALFAVGAHHGSGDSIGRFGHGFKDAATAIGDEVFVDTSNGVHHFKVRVNWKAVRESGQWATDDYTCSKARDAITGTVIQFSILNRRRVRFHDDLLADIAYDFTPGLDNGLTISINGKELKSVPPPRLSKSLAIDDYFEGKHFRLLAGIKERGDEPDRYGYDVAYKNRLVSRRDCARAFGDFSGIHFYGYLELLRDGDDWGLEKNKTGFAERDDLYEFILPKIEPLLEQAARMGEDIRCLEDEAEISQVLSDGAKATLREMRDAKKKEQEAHEPELGEAAPPTERKRKRAAKTSPEEGSIMADKADGIIRVVFDWEGTTVGRVEESNRKTIIHLNTSFKFDVRGDLHARIAIAASLYVNYYVHGGGDPQTSIGFNSDELSKKFTEQFSRLLINAAKNMEARKAAK